MYELIQTDGEVQRHALERQSYRDYELDRYYARPSIRDLAPEPQKHHKLGQEYGCEVSQSFPPALLSHAREEIDVLYRLFPSRSPGGSRS